MPAVSVIIPVYNPGNYLRRCLDSLCNQTLGDIEVICVNDCSTDGSVDILNEYACRDSRVRVIDSKVNHGAATSRNMAIKAAVGEFLSFVDSDDFIDPDFLERLYVRAKETGADIVKGERHLYDPQKDAYLPDIAFMAEMHRNTRSNKACFVNAFTSAIYRTSMVHGHDVRFLDGVVFFEDAYFSIMASVFSERTEVVDGTYYNYTMNPDSVCSKGTTLPYVRNRIQGTVAIMDLLDRYTVSKEHYLTVYSYLLLEMIIICHDLNASDAMLKAGSEGVMLVMGRCRYPDELLFRHYVENKARERARILRQLRDRVKSVQNI